MEPMRVVFWYRDSMGREQNLAELCVRYNSQVHKEGNAFTIQVNIHSSRKVEGETMGVGSDHGGGERLLTMKDIADFNLPPPRSKNRDQPQGNSLVRTTIPLPEQDGAE